MSSPINDSLNDAAFPGLSESTRGMTKREYVAIQILSAHIASGKNTPSLTQIWLDAGAFLQAGYDTEVS